MVLTITFCQCAHYNSVTWRTFSSLSKRRHMYSVFCARLQFVLLDRRIPRRFRFHQQ